MESGLYQNINIKEVLIHFNYFKKITMNGNLKNINKFTYYEKINAYANIITNYEYETMFSKNLVDKKINQMSNKKNIKYIEIQDENIYIAKKNFCFRLILFLTNTDGDLLKHFYFGLKFNKNMKIFPPINMDNYKIEDIVYNDNEYNYYVLCDEHYPFFLINDNNNNNIITINNYNTTITNYNIGTVINNLNKIVKTDIKTYNTLVKDNLEYTVSNNKPSKIHPEKRIKIDTFDLLIYPYYKHASDLSNFELSFTKKYYNFDNKKCINNIVKMLYNSFEFYETSEEEEHKKKDHSNLIYKTLQELESKIKIPDYRSLIYVNFFEYLLD